MGREQTEKTDRFQQHLKQNETPIQIPENRTFWWNLMERGDFGDFSG